MGIAEAQTGPKFQLLLSFCKLQFPHLYSRVVLSLISVCVVFVGQSLLHGSWSTKMSRISVHLLSLELTTFRSFLISGIS